MNKRFKNLIAPSLAVAILAASAGAWADAPKPEKLIQWRQSAYKVVEWNVARIKATIDGQYNKSEVITAANTIAAVANSGLGTLYAPGTEEGKGWHDTNAKPELFKDRARFNELSNNFSKEAAELAKVAAASSDAAAVKEQFGKLTRTCKACHDDFKGKD